MKFVLFFLFLHVILLLPSYSYLMLAKVNKVIILPLSYGLSIIFFATLSTLHYVLNISLNILMIWFWIYVLFGIFLLIYLKFYSSLKRYSFILIVFMSMSAFSLLVISLTFSGQTKFIPDPEYMQNRNYNAFNVKVLNVSQTNANDNSVPYRQAQFFLNRSDPGRDSFIDEWGVHFFQRTPLMGATTAGLLLGIGDRVPINYIWSSLSNDVQNTYIKFQIIAQVLNCLLLIPAFLLIKKIFGEREAKLTSTLIATSPFFLYNSFFTWPKSFVAFFILGSMLFLYSSKKLKYTVLAGIFLALGYLTHDLAILYIASIILVMLISKRFRDALILFGMWVVLIIPWFIYSVIIFKKPSSFILYPLSIEGIPQPQNKKQIIDTFFHTSIIKLIKIRLVSMFYLVTPYQAFFSEGGQAIGRRLWALTLFSIPGSLGFGTFFPVMASFFRKEILKKYDLLIMIFLPIFLSTIIIGWPKGLGALHFAEASVVLLTAFGSFFIIKKRNLLWVLILLLVNFIHMVFFVIYSFGDSYKNWLNTHDLTIVLGSFVFYLALVLYCFRYLANDFAHAKKMR